MPLSITVRRLAAGLAAAMLVPCMALAGEQYVDGSGFALSGYDAVAYRSLEQAPVGGTQPQAVPGRAEFAADYNGARWAFASAANRDAFLADPDRYAPAFDGHCAFGVARGGKVPGNPHLWRIVDGQLYLNINRQVVGFWEADIGGNIAGASGNWDALEQTPAHRGAVPELDTARAPATD